jgi:UDP-N-acetylglucosamine acyltransferase
MLERAVAAPETFIHETAVVSPSAIIGEGCQIGAYAVIGDHVRMGAFNRIGAHAVIDGFTQIGSHNRVSPFSVIGSEPQSDGWRGEPSHLRIGDRNVFRESVTVCGGAGEMAEGTIIGSDNFLMANTHVGHDCRLGDGIHMANCATLAGHIEVGDHAWLSGLCAIHQFARIGAAAFVSGGAMVSQDAPPFCTVQGDRARLVGLNEVGLRRRAHAEPDILALRRAFRMLFMSKEPMRARLEAVAERFTGAPLIDAMLAFIASSQRGVISTTRR